VLVPRRSLHEITQNLHRLPQSAYRRVRAGQERAGRRGYEGREMLSPTRRATRVYEAIRHACREDTMQDTDINGYSGAHGCRDGVVIETIPEFGCRRTKRQVWGCTWIRADEGAKGTINREHEQRAPSCGNGALKNTGGTEGHRGGDTEKSMLSHKEKQIAKPRGGRTPTTRAIAIGGTNHRKHCRESLFCNPNYATLTCNPNGD